MSRFLCLVVMLCGLSGISSAQQAAAPTPAEVAKLIEQLGDCDFAVRSKAEAQLEKYPALTKSPLNESMSKHKDAEVRERSKQVLRRIHEATASDLLKALADANVNARQAAEKEFRALLKKDDFGTTVTRAALVWAMRKHPNKDIQVASKRILTGAPEIARIRALIQDLGDESFDTRVAATNALTKIGWPAMEELQRATKNPDLEIRRRSLLIVKAIESE